MTSRNTTAVRTDPDGGTTGSATPDPDPLHNPPGDPAGNGATAAPAQGAAPDPTTQENEESAGHEPSVLWFLARKQSEVLQEPPLSDDESVGELTSGYSAAERCDYSKPSGSTWILNPLFLPTEDEADQQTGQAHDIPSENAVASSAALPRSKPMLLQKKETKPLGGYTKQTI